MLNRLLKLLGDDAEIDDALYQKIFDNMLERLKDKVAEIRAQAVTALQRLQVKYIAELKNSDLNPWFITKVRGLFW